MPVVAETNFCKTRFEFVKTKQQQGSISACFNPVVLWFGKCTNSEPHSDECSAFFHNKTFFLPLSVCHSVVSDLPSDVQLGYIKQLQSASHLAYFAQRGNREMRLACTDAFDVLITQKNSVNAKTLRKICSSGIGSRKALTLAKQKMTASTPLDLLCISIYFNFVFLKQRMPYDFHAKTYLAAQNVCRHYKLPLELQQLILWQVFTKSQGVYL